MSYKSSRVTDHSDHERKHSTSSSDYSYDSEASTTRRGTTPSKGGADRRRVAIVQMPSFYPRCGQTGLALVAPPDAAPTNYTHLTPPPTANIPSDQDTILHQRDISTKFTRNDDQSSSRRSQSPSKRLTPNFPLTPLSLFSPVTPEIGQAINIPVTGPIVVNLDSHSRKGPSSRNDSPLPDSSSLGIPMSSFLHYQPGVHSVAGPLPPPPRANFNIDINNTPPPRPPRLNSRTPLRSKRDFDSVKQSLQLPPSVTAILASKSSNLSTKSYKEDPVSDLSDVDSKSKTDIKPSKEVPFTDLINADSNSEIKPSIKPSKEVLFTDLSDVDSKSDIKPSSERRGEGACSPLDDIPAEYPSKSAIAPESTTVESENKGATVDMADVTVMESPCNRSVTEIDHHKFSQWLESNPELTQPLGNIRKSGSVDESHSNEHKLPESPEPSDSGGASEAPSPPPKSFRNSLTVNLKRLSLPRTASLSSKSGRSRRWSGGNTHHSSRTSSPSIHRVSPPLLVPKIRSTNPAALFCHEVHSQRTTSERCLIYATKINELHLYDCGLSEWVVNMKSRGPNVRIAPTPQPRHTSRSSVISEATFPSRPDASTATDLSQVTDGDITPTSVSLTLPYPSLAMNPPRTNPSRSNSSIGHSPSIRSLTPSTSISLKSGGFFASLGRKTSLSKKEKPTSLLISSSSSSGSLASPSTKNGRLLSISSKHTSSPSINTMNISKPFNISSPASVPGGPRAPPSRNQRSHTFTPSLPPTSPIANSDIGRRPSMFDLSLDPVIDIRAEPEFVQQVDKLATLLPHANRDVLAGYLRRAGKDMLAIGQYLEDEKNGTIQLYD